MADGVDLLDCTIASVDGEKDPRNLLRAFELVSRLARVYLPGSHGAELAGDMPFEELFDVLACYFPITFTPPPNDQYRISREDLAVGLERALTSVPQLLPSMGPLVLQKLSSSLRQAKADSLSLLGALAEAHGPEAVLAAAPDLWPVLRSEALAPGAPNLSTEEHESRAAMAALALQCLVRCIRAGLPLAEAVMQDSRVLEGFAMLAREGSFGLEEPKRTNSFLEAWSDLLAAVASANSASCALVVSKATGRMCDAAISAWIRLPQGPGALCSCLAALRKLLGAAVEVSLSPSPLTAFARQLLPALFGPEASEGTAAEVVAEQAGAVGALCRLNRDSGVWDSEPSLLPQVISFLLAAASGSAGLQYPLLNSGGMAMEQGRDTGAATVLDALPSAVESLIQGGFVDEVLRSIIEPLLGQPSSEASLSYLEAASRTNVDAQDLLLDRVTEALASGEPLPALTPMLHMLGNRVLPRRPQNADQGPVMRLIQAALQVTGGGEGVADLLEVCCRAMACLSEQTQAEAAAAAGRVLLSTQVADDAVLCVASGLFSSSTPMALGRSGAAELTLVETLLEAACSSSRDQLVTRSCSIAVASVLLKCPGQAGMSEQVHLDVERRVRSGGLASTVGGAMQCASALIQSAALQASAQASGLLEALLAVLRDPATPARAVLAASAAVGDSLDEGTAAAIVGQGPTPKLLWRQRHFTALIRALEAGLRDGPEIPGLLAAFVQVLGKAPAAGLSQEGPRLLHHLLRALHLLMGMEGATAAVKSGVLTLGILLTLPKGLEAADASLDRVVGTLTQFARWPVSATVRETALECMVALMALPYPRLHPHRGDIVKTATQALDDNRRSVRSQAAKCKRVWIAV